MSKKRKKLPDLKIPHVPIPRVASLELPHAVPGRPFEVMAPEDYTLIFRLDVLADDVARSGMLGRREPRCCRVCGLSAPRARFSKEAHVIPQALGNRKWLTWEECDEC